VDVLAPALIAATTTLLVLAITSRLNWTFFRQKEGNDLREGHWKRIAWAVDLSLADGDERHRKVSSSVLEALAAEPGMDPYDYLVVQTAIKVQAETLELEEAAVLAQMSEQEYDAAAAAGSDEAAVDSEWDRG
jgi:hypothetical protein